MWRRIWELCDAVTDVAGDTRREAIVELLDEMLLREWCRHALRDGPIAQSTLESCYQTLSSSAVDTLIDSLGDDVDKTSRQHALRLVAATCAVIEARRLAVHGGSMGPLLRWSARAGDAPPDDRSSKRLERIEYDLHEVIPIAGSTATECMTVAVDWLRRCGIDTLGAKKRMLTMLRAVKGTSSRSRAVAGASDNDWVRLRSLAAAIRHEFGMVFHAWDLLALHDAAGSSQTARSDRESSRAEHRPPTWTDAFEEDHFALLARFFNSSDTRLRHEALRVTWQITYAIARKEGPGSLPSGITLDFHTALATFFTSEFDSEREKAASVACALAVLRGDPGAAVQMGINPPFHEELLALLEDQVDAVRAVAAVAVTLSTPPEALLIGNLAPLLEDPSSTVGMIAARCLARQELDVSAPGLTGYLERALTSTDGRMLTAVLEVISRLRPAAPDDLIQALATFLLDPVSSVRASAVRAVTHSAQTAATVAVFAALVQLLGDPDEEVRAAVASAIGAFGMTAPAQLRDGLSVLLLERNETMIRAVSSTICRLGRFAATPELLERTALLLGRPEGSLLIPAIRAMGPSAATPAILKQLARMFISMPEAFALAQALGRKAFRQSLAHFADLFRHPVRRVRDEAVRAAMSLRGALAVPDFLDEVVKLLHDVNPDTRATTVAAVEAIGPPAATPAIRDALEGLRQDANSYVRYKVEQTIRAIDPDAKLD
jgi:HEAT repeat protein